MKKKWLATLFAGITAFTQQTGITQETQPNHENQQQTTQQQTLQRDELHNKLVQGRELTQEEISFLFQIREEIEQKSPQGNNDHLLTQQEKDLRYFSTLYLEEQRRIEIQERKQELRQELNNFIDRFMPGSDSHFMNNVRFQNDAVSLENNQVRIDFREINPNLSEQIIRLSREYDINARLVTAICTIENNFGLQRVSETNARGMCQTKVPLVRNYYPNYDSFSESEKNWAHFVTTFKYLVTLRDTYSLSIRYRDSAFSNKVDFMFAGLLYYNGETRVLNRENIVYQNDSKQYLLRLLGSFHYPRFVLAENTIY